MVLELSLQTTHSTPPTNPKQQRLQIKEYSEKFEMLKSKHESDMRLKDNEISDLREKNATMLRLIQVDHPGWAPGVTSGTTGG